LAKKKGNQNYLILNTVSEVDEKNNFPKTKPKIPFVCLSNLILLLQKETKTNGFIFESWAVSFKQVGKTGKQAAFVWLSL
jgi:hypothetical protein